MKLPLTMILAGGRGKRMDILCHDRAKPSLPFGNYRVIDFTLSNCFHSGIQDIAALVDYQRSNVARYLKDWCLTNTADRNLLILEPKFGSYKGTADAVCQHTAYLRKRPEQEILLLAADHVYKMDYRKMVAYHQAMHADATVGVVSVPIEQAHRFGIVRIADDGRIMNFVEKPSKPQGQLASMGIYVFKKDVLLERLAEDAVDKTSVHDFGHVIMPKMADRDKVYAYVFDDYWRDIGDVDSYYQANIDMINRPSPFSLDGEWPVMTRTTHVKPPNLIGVGRVINSIVSPGCIIKGIVENSVLSPGVRIESQARVRDSVVMANSFIGEHSVVDRSIVDEEVSIGKYCYIGFGANVVCDKDEITVVGKGVSIPNHTAIGCKCKVLPNVKAIDFDTNAVRPGAVITGGLIDLKAR